MGSFKGWELEALAPDVQLDLRDSSSWLAESTAAFCLSQMASGQILELVVADSRAVGELAYELQACGHRLLKIESLSTQGLLVWLQHGPDQGSPWDFDGDLLG
jgi:hypothetical protein